MAWFQGFRNEHGFTSYNDNQTPVTVDLPLVAVIYFCVLVAIATLIATLGIRGSEKWSSIIRASYAVAIGSIILLCNFSHGWHEGSVQVRSSYVYRSNFPFQGRVGISVALHGANVTLDGYYKSHSGLGYVYYAESMPWTDFGKGTECFNAFLQRGLPDPVLKVMEFLTIDEGGLRWGRSYHSAGHYAWVLLWTAFAFWVVSNVLLFSVIVYGAYMFLLTGVAMILAGITYHVCLNAQPLEIVFGDHVLQLDYGWCFWLNLVAGILTTALGLFLIIMDQFAHHYLAEFFNLEKLTDEDAADHPFSGPDKKRKNLLKQGFMMDHGPFGQPRKGSIFLEPERRPSWYSDNIRQTLSFAQNRSANLVNKGFEPDTPAKLNPIYSPELMLKTPKADYQHDEICLDMERVCLDSEVCLSSRKPSLATLKEHRENHANERRSSGQPASNQPSSSSTNGILKNIATEPGDIRSCSTSGMSSFGTSQEVQSDVESPPRRSSSSSGHFTPSEHSSLKVGPGYSVQKEALSNGQVRVCVETYTRQSSSSSANSHHGDFIVGSRFNSSDEEITVFDHGESVATAPRKNKKRSFSSRENSEVILQVENS